MFGDLIFDSVSKDEPSTDLIYKMEGHTRCCAILYGTFMKKKKTNTYTIHILYVYYTYVIHMLYMCYTYTILYYTIHILYIYYTYTVHILCIYYPFTILYIYYTFSKFQVPCFLGWNLNFRLPRTHELLVSPTKHILRRCYPRLTHNQLASSKHGSFNLPNVGGIKQAANGQFWRVAMGFPINNCCMKLWLVSHNEPWPPGACINGSAHHPKPPVPCATSRPECRVRFTMPCGNGAGKELGMRASLWVFFMHILGSFRSWLSKWKHELMIVVVFDHDFVWYKATRSICGVSWVSFLEAFVEKITAFAEAESLPTWIRNMYV